jgi:hypothetical protein
MSTQYKIFLWKIQELFKIKMGMVGLEPTTKSLDIEVTKKSHLFLG